MVCCCMDMLDSIQFPNWMNKNNSQWHCPHTGTQINAHVQRHLHGIMLVKRSIGTSALCSAVSNWVPWLQVRCRTHFRLKWFSLWNMDRVHDPLWQLRYWDKMLLLVMWCQGGQMASLNGSPACNPVSFVMTTILPCFSLTPPFGLTSCV